MMVKTVAPLSSLTILRNFSSAMLIRLSRLIRSLSLTAMKQRYIPISGHIEVLRTHLYYIKPRRKHAGQEGP